MRCERSFRRDGASVALRAMRVEDLSQVVGIEREAFAEPWRREDFEAELLIFTDSVLKVAVDGDEVVGYYVLWRVAGSFHLANVAVRRDWRGKGVGRALVEDAVAEARAAGALRVTLEVRKSNLPARALYRKLGFVAVGLKKNYYRREREDAVVMRLDFGRKDGAKE